MSENKPISKKGTVIIARHGERIDYALRDLKKNWIPTSDRPWDPPLTSLGRMQGRKLGSYLSHLLAEKGLPPVTAVYSSPMVRCCQTAAEAIIGITTKSNDDNDPQQSSDLKVTIEPGLIESMNEDWYRSWCLPDSNGTWGGPTQSEVDADFIDPRAILPAHTLVQGPNDIRDFLQEESSSTPLVEFGHANGRQVPFIDNRNLAERMDVSPMVEINALYPIQSQPYKYGVFETSESQQERVERVARLLSEKYPEETVLLVSHGGPCTHAYHRMTGKKFETLATYTSFTVYRPSEEGGRDAKWEALVVNESAHVRDIQSADYKGLTFE